MNTKNMGNEELQALFEDVFQEQVASYNNIQDFEVNTTRNVKGDKISFEVTITGLADTPSIDEFKRGKVKNSKSIEITRADKGSMTFKLAPEKTVFLSGNDYIIVYENV